VNRKLTRAEGDRIKVISRAFNRALDAVTALHDAIFNEDNRNLNFDPRFRSLIHFKQIAVNQFPKMQQVLVKLQEAVEP